MESIGFLMLSALMMGGMSIRHAGATKNALASVIGLTAVIVLVSSPLMHWREALILGAGSVLGGLCGWPERVRSYFQHPAAQYASQPN